MDAGGGDGADGGDGSDGGDSDGQADGSDGSDGTGGSDGSDGTSGTTDTCADDPPTWVAPAACGRCSGNTCAVDCSGLSACLVVPVDCPEGWDCAVDCSGLGACTSLIINGPVGGALDVACSGVGACAAVALNCADDAHCDLECSGVGSCGGGLLSRGDKACEASCTGAGAALGGVACNSSCDCVAAAEAAAAQAPSPQSPGPRRAGHVGWRPDHGVSSSGPSHHRVVLGGLGLAGGQAAGQRDEDGEIGMVVEVLVEVAPTSTWMPSSSSNSRARPRRRTRPAPPCRRQLHSRRLAGAPPGREDAPVPLRPATTRTCRIGSPRRRPLYLAGGPTPHRGRRMGIRELDEAPTQTALLGPTNTGKTHRAVRRMLARRSGMIGLPLRLLAREVYDRVTAEVGEEQVALVTGEEKRVPRKPRYWVCTVEAMPVDHPVEFLAVDEIQLCAHRERGHVFTDRLLNARGRVETWFLGADTARGVIADLVPTAEIQTRPRFSQLQHAGCDELSDLPPRSAVVAFSIEQVYAVAERIRRRRGGAAVVLGALSPGPATPRWPSTSRGRWTTSSPPTPSAWA